MAAAGVRTYSYGQGATLSSSPSLPSPTATIPRSEPASVLSVEGRRLWDTPLFQRQRESLRVMASEAGIAGKTGSYASAAERTGFTRELQRIAGPKEIGPLAELYKRAWGTSHARFPV
jgi:hypothetical protein